MRTELFDFDLPPALIAQRPAEPRDAARLLVVGEHTLDDRSVRDLPSLLEPGDLLVLNDTRVIPARLLGRRGEATVEVTLHQALDASSGREPDRVRPAGAACCWRAFARPAKRLRAGDRVRFGPGLETLVLEKGEDGEQLGREHQRANAITVTPTRPRVRRESSRACRGGAGA